jgi:hypothetical protein
LVGAVKSTSQELAVEFQDVSEHVALLNVVPTPPGTHDTVPLGELAVPAPTSFTIALSQRLPPTPTDAVPGDMAVIVWRGVGSEFQDV